MSEDAEVRTLGDCPECGARNWQELSYRDTWQPVTLDDAAEPDDYSSFDYGDDSWVYGVECRSCYNSWPSYTDLRLAMLGEPHATGVLPDVQVFAPPTVWIVLRGVESGEPEMDVFTSERAAQAHYDVLTADGVQPDVFPPREEQSAHTAWAEKEAE